MLFHQRFAGASLKRKEARRQFQPAHVKPVALAAMVDPQGIVLRIFGLAKHKTEAHLAPAAAGNGSFHTMDAADRRQNAPLGTTHHGANGDRNVVGQGRRILPDISQKSRAVFSG